ncbi:insecticidal delta-endotoxin Cry8Ea1 family protein [Bacillus toyonensis]
MNQNYNNNEYEILDMNNSGYRSRYPLANAPGSEFQQMNYKDWMDMCTRGESGELFSSARNGVIIATGIGWAILGFVPVIGPGLSAISGLLNVLVPFLWPEEQETSQPQFTWQQLMNAVEELIDQRIDALIRSRAIETTRILQSRIRDYQQAICNLKTDPNNEAYKADVRREFNDADDQAKAAIIQFNPRNPDGTEDAKHNILLLADYAQAANVHLLLLRDVVQFGESWGFSPLEIQQYYSNTTSVGNPGMLQLLANYTNHCVRWYNAGLATFNSYFQWQELNTFRRDMTIMVLDIASLWPTYDPKSYPVIAKSQLTRVLYTPAIGNDTDFEKLLPPPSLFSWLREAIFYTPNPVYRMEYVKYTLVLQKTLSNDRYEQTYGSNFGADIAYSVKIGTAPNSEVYRMHTNAVIYSNDNASLGKITFHFSPSGTSESVGREIVGTGIDQGFACRSNLNEPCDPCVTACEVGSVNASLPCDSPSLYSERLSWISGEILRSVNFSALNNIAYGWTHVSADANNLISAEQITQIPAVKAYELSGDALVIKGPGSTGGDLVQLSSGAETGQMAMWITTPQGSHRYRVRIRYASSMQTNLEIFMTGAFGEFSAPATTTDTTNLTYDKFGYLETVLYSYAHVEESTEHIRMYATGSGSGSFILDKIEFIPIEGSLEAYQADQDVEKARKAVNALFTGDAKNALKLNVTDYAVDQAANLVECVSEDFHAQEKMILLDQVKLAKRLSQARNLLNYGDFESPDWSGENGWKTSPHVHVASDNPIFKGHYLHMPGANQPQMSDTIYPTYIYQKVDESKLKSYTRYHVRGFVGNSKNLELFVERYGKEVHVEMDVPNDIRYTLPMNECGGFDRCGHSSYQAGTDSRTCTCKDTARMDAECQCKDQPKRTASGVYTNAYAGNDRMYPDGYHAHKSCGCNKKGGYPNGKHAHKSCGCKDPHVFSFHIDTGCVDVEENAGLLFALKIASTDGLANIDNLEIIEGQPLTGEALARVKKREHRWKEEMKQKRCKTKETVEAALTAINALFTNKQYNRLKFDTLFPHILHTDELVQRIPYVYHPFLQDAYPDVPGMNYAIFQQLSSMINRARGLYDMRNLVQNGTFSSGAGSWHVTDGVNTQPEGNTSVLVLREWSDKAVQNLRIDEERGYVLRVTARKEGNGDGYVVIHDCDNQMEKLTFTACDYSTTRASTGTQATVIPVTNCPPCHSGTWGEERPTPITMLTGYVTKTAEIFPDTDRIRIEIGETEGTFKIESVELICMEHMEDHMYDMAGNLEEEMQGLGIESSHAVTHEMCFSWDIMCPMEASIPPIVPPTNMYDMAGNVEEEMKYLKPSSMASTLDPICYTKIGEFGCPLNQ